MRKVVHILSVVAVALALSGFVADAPVNTVRFAEPGTSLDGTLLRDFTMVKGELSKATLLYIENGVTIVGNEDAVERRDRRTARKVQRVFIDPSYEVADSSLGATVRVTGTLSNQRNRIHRTDVSMFVTDLQVLAPFDGDENQPAGTFSTRPGGR